MKIFKNIFWTKKFQKLIKKSLKWKCERNLVKDWIDELSIKKIKDNFEQHRKNSKLIYQKYFNQFPNFWSFFCIKTQEIQWWKWKCAWKVKKNSQTTTWAIRSDALTYAESQKSGKKLYEN